MPSERSRDIGSKSNDPGNGGKRALQRMLPASWRFAHQTATDLLARIEHLAWRDRADLLDVYFSRQADGMPKNKSLALIFYL